MTPEQEEQVRRALAATARAEDEARPQPLPDHVARRLDDVLAELTANRRSAAAGPGHDELARQRQGRQHRRGPQLLVAAATVAVIALAGGAVATGGFGMSGGGGSADSAAAGSSAEKAVPDQGLVQGTAPANADGFAAGPAPGAPQLRRASLQRDVTAALDAVASGSARSQASAPTDAPSGTLDQSQNPAQNPAQPPASPGPATGTCALPAAAPGSSVLVVRLDGRPATLVAGPVRNGARVARVYACDDPGRVLARTSVRR